MMMAGMAEQPPTNRFYTDLAIWWPLVSPPEEYEEEADESGACSARQRSP